MFEVWFTYRGSRRWRVAVDEGQRDAAVAELNDADGVENVTVIDLGETA